MEKWIPIKGYEEHYEVSNYGRVRNIPRAYCLTYRGGRYVSKTTVNKPTNNGKGYGRVFLSKYNKVTTKYVHRLVAENWCSNPLKCKEINHIDGNKSNNKSDNLEWVTRRQNVIHARRAGLFIPSFTKFTIEQVDEILLLCGQGVSPIRVARLFQVYKTSIYNILAGRTWSWYTHISRKGVVT